MSDRVHELLRRNLQEVFGEGNAARRRAAIDELYTEDCVLYVPPSVFFYMDPAHYRANFAADSPPELADFMAASQVLLSKKAFEAPVRAAAWKMKTSGQSCLRLTGRSILRWRVTREGVTLFNCSPYISDWAAKDRERIITTYETSC